MVCLFFLCIPDQLAVFQPEGKTVVQKYIEILRGIILFAAVVPYHAPATDVAAIIKCYFNFHAVLLS